MKSEEESYAAPPQESRSLRGFMLAVKLAAFLVTLALYFSHPRSNVMGPMVAVMGLVVVLAWVRFQRTTK